MIDNSNLMFSEEEKKDISSFANQNKTLSASSKSFQKSFFVIDATGCVLGRLASFIAKIIMGKHRPYYTKHSDCGDKVVVINCDKVALSAKKFKDKEYFWHTGYNGSLKSRTPEQQFEKNNHEFLIKNAVKGMIKRGPLGYKMIKNLFIYKGPEHKHDAQKPTLIDFKSINKKNSIKA